MAMSMKSTDAQSRGLSASKGFPDGALPSGVLPSGDLPDGDALSGRIEIRRPARGIGASLKLSVGRAQGREVTLPRMSKHLRRLLEKVAQTLWKAQGAATKMDGACSTLSVPPMRLGVEKKRSGLKISWSVGGARRSEKFNKSEFQSLLRSLQSNGAGSIRVKGFGQVSWQKSGAEVREIAREHNVISRAPGNGWFSLTKEAVRSRWDAGFRLLKETGETFIRLSEAGRRLLADIWAWERAKQKGVPLARARSNENLDSSYLSASERRDPGRYRSRSLYKEEVGGTSYYAKKDLIAKGTPPALEGEHTETDGRIADTLKGLEIEGRGTLFGRAAPSLYIEKEDETYKRTKQWIGLENGMLVSSRPCLYLMETFPDATWTTAHYHDRVKRRGSEDKEIYRTYPVLVGKSGELLASLAPSKKRLKDVR